MTSPTADTSSLFADFSADAQRRSIDAATAALIARMDTQNLDAVARAHLGELLLNSGFAATAIALLDRAAAHFPQSIELRYWLGNALRMAGDFAAAETEFRGALEHHPAHRDATYSLAYMLREQGRTQAAAELVVALWENAQFDADSALAAIGFQVECAAYVQALPIAREAQGRWPHDARIAVRTGEIELALGHFDEAAGALRSALEHDPAQSAAWLRLAYCQRFTDPDHADIARFRHGWNDSMLNPTSRTCAGFALGKALDDIGEYAQAAQVLREANARVCATTTWRSADWKHELESSMSTTSIPMPVQSVTINFVPVFIIGLPRTGTTLIANALAREASVHDRGELNWIPALHAHLAGSIQTPRSVAHVAAAAAMIREARLCRDDAPATVLHRQESVNFRYLDFIVSIVSEGEGRIIAGANRATPRCRYGCSISRMRISASPTISPALLPTVDKGYRGN